VFHVASQEETRQTGIWAVTSLDQLTNFVILQNVSTSYADQMFHSESKENISLVLTN
jgi:hypothetical protein